MSLPRRRALRSGGFTLLELIVAVSILALIAVFAWRGLDALIREREALAASQGTIDALQRAFARIERDALAASDVQIDDDGTMQLDAGSTVEGSPPATVRYRIVDGVLTRTVVGIDRGPLAVLTGVTASTFEAWVPTSRGGGAWARSRVPVREPVDGPRAPAPGTVTATPSPAEAPSPAVQAVQAIAAQSGQVPGSNTASGASTPNASAPAPTIVATGVRLSLARGGGPPVVRTFIVGGA